MKRLQSAREKYERKTVEAEQAERRLARVEPDTGQGGGGGEGEKKRRRRKRRRGMRMNREKKKGEKEKRVEEEGEGEKEGQGGKGEGEKRRWGRKSKKKLSVPGISRGEVEQAREEATERRGRASRGREEYDRQVSHKPRRHSLRLVCQSFRD